MDYKPVDSLAKWSPWEKFKEDQQLLPITEPPCKGCGHFKPVRIFQGDGKFLGIRICHSEEMEHDFSCFRTQYDIDKAKKGSW